MSIVDMKLSLTIYVSGSLKQVTRLPENHKKPEHLTSGPRGEKHGFIL